MSDQATQIVRAEQALIRPDDIVGTCEICGQPVSRFKNGGRHRLRGDLRFCSRPCYRKRVRDPQTVEDRFWSKVNKDGPVHPVFGKCWVWVRHVSEKGYGWFGVGRRGQRGETSAHRYSWVMRHGEIPDGLCVLHRCDNPPCVNPDHLFLGTKIDNNLDAVSKGRHQHGEGHSFAILTDATVREIRRRYRPWDKTNGLAVMAREFGVSYKAMQQVISRKTWKHVE